MFTDDAIAKDKPKSTLRASWRGRINPGFHHLEYPLSFVVGKSYASANKLDFMGEILRKYANAKWVGGELWVFASSEMILVLLEYCDASPCAGVTGMC